MINVIIPKNFHCSGCGGQHKRPVGVKCQLKTIQILISILRVSILMSILLIVNHDILNALTSVSSRLTAIEQRIQKTEDQLQKGATSLSDGVTSPAPTVGSHRPREMDSDEEDDVFTPTTAFLKSSRGIQNAVDRRLQELASLNEQGMFKSQRCGHDQVTVKHKVPWPQNKGDHHTAGKLYKHIYSFCNTLGKRFPHALKECRNSKKSTGYSKNE